jgi:hypothetical protein
LLKRQSVRSKKERELWLLKKQEIKSQSTKINKPNKKHKTKLLKKRKRRLQQVKRNDWRAI